MPLSRLRIFFEHVRLFERFLFLAGEASFDLFHVFGGREVASRLGLDFLNGGQAAAQFIREGFGELGLPCGDGDGLVESAEGILGDKLVLFPAEQEADGGRILD